MEWRNKSSLGKLVKPISARSMVLRDHANIQSQWFDPKSGIAATLVVQNMPPGDAVVSELYEELEQMVYTQF